MALKGMTAHGTQMDNCTWLSARGPKRVTALDTNRMTVHNTKNNDCT